MVTRIELSGHRYATAKLDNGGLHVSFEVFDVPAGQPPEWASTEGPIWTGFVKWDGCSNWLTGSQDQPGFAHFCDEENERAIGDTFVLLRRKALKMMGDKADFTVAESRGERMEALLSEAMGWLDDPSAYAQNGEPRDFDRRVEAMIAEIDAARKVDGR